MKIRIANILDGAARALLAAGTFGVTAVLMGETTPYSPLGRPTPVSHGAEEGKAHSTTAKNPRMIEMKVELAWLADPVTSPCRLEARTAGSTLEVHGQVPNEAVLAHALHLAGEESGMRVASKIQINSRLRAPGGSKRQDVLHQDAFNALRRGFPEQAPSLSISTLADGQIVLKGTVPTYEDKLAISRHLRQATTCSCVINQLHVLAERQGREAQSQRSSWSAAATLLPPEPLKPQPVQPVAHVLRSESASPPIASPVSHSSAETTPGGKMPPGPKTAAIGSQETSSARPTAQAERERPHQAPEARPATTAKPAAKSVVYQTKWRRLDPSEVPAPKKTMPVATSKESAPAKQETPRAEKVSGTFQLVGKVPDTFSAPAKQEAPATPSKPQTYLRVIPSPNEHQATPSGESAPAKTETAALVKQSFQHHLTPDQPAASTADVSAARPQIVAGSIANPSPALRPQTPPRSQTPVWERPAARPRVPSVAKREPYVTDGVVLIESSIKPASHSVPVTGQKHPPILRTGPYVTNGVILLSDSTPGGRDGFAIRPTANDGGLNQNPALAALQTRLQQRIAAVCGKSSKEVEVTAVTETNVSVRVKAYNILEGEELSNRIFQLPELGPCQVSLDVLVMK